MNLLFLEQETVQQKQLFFSMRTDALNILEKQNSIVFPKDFYQDELDTFAIHYIIMNSTTFKYHGGARIIDNPPYLLTPKLSNSIRLDNLIEISHFFSYGFPLISDSFIEFVLKQYPDKDILLAASDSLLRRLSSKYKVAGGLFTYSKFNFTPILITR